MHRHHILVQDEECLTATVFSTLLQWPSSISFWPNPVSLLHIERNYRPSQFPVTCQVLITMDSPWKVHSALTWWTSHGESHSSSYHLQYQSCDSYTQLFLSDKGESLYVKEQMNKSQLMFGNELQLDPKFLFHTEKKVVKVRIEKQGKAFSVTKNNKLTRSRERQLSVVKWRFLNIQWQSLANEEWR